MKILLWATALVATVGGRGLAAILVVPPLVAGVWYLMRRTNRRSARVQAATDSLRELGGQEG
jgi:hypothetical protein